MKLRTVTLGEVTNNFDYKRRPIKTTERVQGPFPYYGASGVIDSVEDYIFDDEYLLVAEDGENLRSRSLPIAFLAQGKFWVNNHAHVVQGNSLADTRFLSHLLSITDVSGYLTGSTQPKLTRSAMDSIRLDIPALPEQQAIAEVLSALDDKIAANAKLAATADEWARASLFECTAKSGGTVRIADIVEATKTSVAPSSMDTDTPYVGLEHIPRRCMWLSNAGKAESVSSTKAKFERGDILFGKLRPYFHKVVGAPFAGVCSTDILTMRANPRIAGFALATIASDLVVQEAMSVSEGTRMPRTSWKDLASVQVPWPGEARAAELSAKISEMQSTVEVLLLESKTLAATRDTLLPHLISGHLRLKDAEATVSAAMQQRRCRPRQSESISF